MGRTLLEDTNGILVTAAARRGAISIRKNVGRCAPVPRQWSTSDQKTVHADSPQVVVVGLDISGLEHGQHDLNAG